MSDLQRWRVEMQKCLLEIEIIEREKKPLCHLSDAIRTKIENLGRDFLTMQGKRP
jgi:hypothetical protein